MFNKMVILKSKDIRKMNPREIEEKLKELNPTREGD